MWFHHPSQALPLTATVPRLPNGMERKARRAYRSVLDLVVATCTAALAGAMSVVPPDPRRVAGVVPSASRPCPDVICTGDHVGVKGATCDLSELDLRSQRRRVVSGAWGVDGPPGATGVLSGRGGRKRGSVLRCINEVMHLMQGCHCALLQKLCKMPKSQTLNP